MKPRTHKNQTEQKQPAPESRRNAAEAGNAGETDANEAPPAEVDGNGAEAAEEGDPESSLEADLMKWRELAMRTSRWITQPGPNHSVR